ncbi:ankyrin repeat domain-containing protein [Rhizobiaceae bacterium BDR2-2]|uniref:Ankyrin repeat domain-containing protein n=1 Tax=Ectorhizobium quercum TaxID=2965071 RepID=A0AAE3SWQ3_9HYPH|nr:ankyrin repeat domain-containing protein [Ectorhizobium quercum]MCX8998274.1 ankyrin repeat domain-containing protein [Ectorhizobium quercum]
MTKTRKKKTLPKDFEELLTNGDCGAIKAVFETCDVHARGGSFKKTALAFNALPDDVARWLVEKGADISAPDAYGETPLHARAGHWQGRIDILLELGADVNGRDGKGNTPLHKAAAVGNVRTARTLLEHGASIDATNDDRLTPLELALQRCSNANIRAIADMSDLLLNAQAPRPAGIRTLAARLFTARRQGDDRISPQMQDFVRRIGENFEFHRSGFNPDSREETSAALDRLYALFDVPPVPRRAIHDGRSPIMAKAASWQDRHQELWELLVPSSGAAETVQGEVIRISGRIAGELDGNGGINWDAEFRQMADALLVHLGSGKPLPAPELKEAATIVGEVKRKYGDTRRLSELAVAWVALNPKPVALPAPSYRR